MSGTADERPSSGGDEGPALRVERVEGGSIVLVVENRTERPLLVLAEGAGTETMVAREVGSRLRGKRLQDGRFAMHARLMVESIGPEARQPSPPRWENDGDREVVCAPVVAPGGRWRSQPMRQAEAGVARVRYAPLPRDATLLEVTRAERLPVESAGQHQRGWVPAEQARLEAAPTDAVDPAKAQGMSWTATDLPALRPGLDAAPLPALQRYAVWANTYDLLRAVELEAAVPAGD